MILKTITHNNGKPNISEIAKELGYSRQTIYNEMKRNSSSIYRTYTATQAQKRRDEQRKNSNKKPFIPNHLEIQEYIHLALIKYAWSPEIIVEWARKENMFPKMPCKEAIYQYIYRMAKEGKEDLRPYLRFKRKRRQNRSQYKKRRGMIKDRIFIDKRDEIVKERVRIGDWEVDTIEMRNRKGYILTLVERCSRYTLAYPLVSKNAQHTSDVIIRLLKPFADIGWVKTITFDNGKKFAYHQLIKEKLNTSVFFSHLYSAWEKATIENFNGQYRYFIPKSTPFCFFESEHTLQHIVNTLNNKPRKTLNYLSANQFILMELNKILMSKIKPSMLSSTPNFLPPKLSNFQMESAKVINIICNN